MLRQLYTDIIQRIKTKENLFTERGLKPVKHYDWYNGQYQDESLVYNHPFATPAVFFELEVAFSDAGQGVQNGDINLKIHVVQEVYAQSFDGEYTSIDQDKALQIADYLDLINECLHRSTGEYISSLRRVKLSPSISFSHLYAGVIEYQGLVVDGSTYKLKNYVDSSGNHAVNLTNKVIKERLPTANIESKYSIPL
jgi:hypothetical protein